MNVTVAICTWNRVSLLAHTLEGFKAVRVAPGLSWEVLVVDNGSTDGTSEFLRSQSSTGYPLRFTSESRLGVSLARNRALAETHAELILFVDDDVLVHPDLITALCEAANRHPEASALGGVIDPWFTVDPDPVLAKAFPVLGRGFCGIQFSDVEELLPAGHHLVGANVAYRRAHIEGLTFREDLGPRGFGTIGGEENDFQDQIRARGGTILWVPTMKVRHYVDPSRMTLPYLLRFAEDAGRKEIRLNGVPPGTRVAGVPRWLIGNAVKEHARAVAEDLRLNRIEALVHRRRAAEFGGMIRECRRQHLVNREPAVAPVDARI
jgi:glycosyltransferase involved in cell wall biosynthesis/ribosomal protein L30/L7E